MSKEIHALKDRSGQIFWPATATDAIIHPKTRSSLTDHIEKYNLTGDNTIDSLEDGIAKLVTLGISQHLGVQIEILNTSGILEEWTYYDPSKLFSNPAGWRRGGEVDDTLDATSENPVQNKVIYQALVENEEIAANALADLDDRISDLEDYDLNTRVSDLESIDYEPRFQEIEETIDQNEEITTEALCNLDSRIRDIEAGSTTGEVINFSETKYIDVVEGNGTDISSGDVSGRQFTVTEDDYYSEEIDNFYPNLEVRYSTTGSGVVYIPLFPTGVDGTFTFTSNQVRVGDYNYLAEIDNNYLNIRRTLAGTGSIRTLPVPNTSTPLAVGDTYDEAFGKIKKIISDNEVVTAAGLTDLNRRVVGITDTLTTKADLVNGTVPAAQLPSYVDDVLEYANLAGFPQSGETGKIYVALDTNLTYRWSGTAYVEISKSIVPYVIDLSNISFSGEDDDSSNGVFEFGGGMHDYYTAPANNLPAEIDINSIISAIDNKQDIYFTDNYYSNSFNNYLVTYSYKDVTSATRIILEARTISHSAIHWIDFSYNSSYGLTILKGFWSFRKDVNQIKNSIVILPGSIISGLLDPNAQVEANSYYAMDMGKFTNGSAIGAVLYTHQEFFNILAGSTSFSSDANLIRPVLFFEGLDQVTSIIDLSPMQVVSVDFSLYSSAPGQNLVLVAEGEEHKYTVEIEKDVTTKPINIITSDKDYSNQEINDLIEEVELVTAAGFNNLNERVLQNKSDIDELEEVTSVSLNGLNERVEDLEDDVREILDTGNLIKTTYLELKELRDTKQLVPGRFYRITDYQCTTSQENTASAGHQFDIIILALGKDTLSEDAWATMHDNDIYDITFSDGITKKCYLYPIDDVVNVVDVTTLLGVDVGDDEITINEETKTATTVYPSTETSIENLTYNYFQNCNLSAWKLKYALEDTTIRRFLWSVPGFVEGEVLTTLEYGVNKYYRRSANRTRVVGGATYYEWELISRNSSSSSFYEYCCYTNSENPEQGDEVKWRASYADYTMTTGQVISVDLNKDFGGRGIIYYMKDEYENECSYDFKNILFKRWAANTTNFDSSFDSYGSGSTGYMHWSNSSSSLWGMTVSTQTPPYYYYTFTKRTDLTVQNCENIDASIITSGCKGNSLKPSRGEVSNPSLSYIKLNNIVILSGNYNTFGYDCSNISIAGGSSNTFLDGCKNIWMKYSFRNKFDNECSYIYLCQSSNNVFGSYNTYMKLYQYSHCNQFGIECSYCTTGKYTEHCRFGGKCLYIDFNNKSYYRNIAIESGNRNITLSCTSTTSSSQYYRNVTIAKGTNNSASYKTISDSNVNQDFQTIYKPANCQEISV